MEYKVEEKLEALVRTLNDIKTIKEVKNLEVDYVLLKNPNLDEIKKTAKFRKYNYPRVIYKTYSYYWFKCSFTVNKHDKNINSYFCVNLSKLIEKHLIRRAGIEYWNGERKLMKNSEDFLLPQGLLYLNNKLVSAIDNNHNEILLNKSGKYEMYLYLYSDNFEKSYPIDFSIKYKDKRIEQAYYDYLCVLEDIGIILKNDRKYKKLIKIINEAINMIDLRNVDNNLFTSLAKSRKFLKERYFEEQGGKESYFIDCIGHSHIDMAWLWDIEQTRNKSQRTFATVLKLMDEYPEYKFIHTSPQLFEFLKQDNPKLYRRIKQRIKEKRFEVDGAMWVEPDCNLTSGESLVRQVLYGKEFMKKEFNIDSKILFLPDVFGYSYQLPQILKKSGVNQFATSKIGWNDTNRFPLNLFRWVGLDGTSVFAYLISTCTANPRQGINDTDGTSYNGNLTANELLGTWNRYQNKKYNNVVFTTYGYGDGGGGPTREMLEKQRRYAYGLPGLGKTRTSTLKDSLNRIESNFDKSCKKYKKIPTWNDELYLEYHRGTYTSVPWIKKINRETEFNLLNTELFASINSIINKKRYPQSEIIDAYKKLLLNQFHDILPGSSIKKVYDDAHVSFAQINKVASNIISNSLSDIALKLKSKYILFNPNYFEIKQPVIVNDKCFVRSVPSFGYRSINLESSDNDIKLGKKEISNKYFDVKFNDKGEIYSLYDKINRKQIVAKNSAINSFISYEDIPYKWDNWEVSPYYKQKKYPLDKKAKFTKIDQGDRKGFKIVRTYGNSEITQYVYLYKIIDRIDFENSIVWKEKRQLLKVHFPLNIKTKKARFDVQFGSISRNTFPKNKFDEAKFEVCAQKWVDMSNGKYGVALLNNGKYGHAVDANDLSLTVLKSGSFPYPEASDEIPDFTFSLYPHLGNYQNSDVVKQAYSINRPAILYTNKVRNKFCDEVGSYIQMHTDGVVLETLKKANDGNYFILRGYECSGMEKNVKVNLNFDCSKAYLCDLLENEVSVLKVKDKTLSFAVKPFEIFTIKIK